MSISGLTGRVLPQDASRKMTSAEKDELQARLTPKHSEGPADNASENLYAEIVVSGKVVGKVYQGGVTELPNAYAGLGLSLTNSGSGTQLAQNRAEQIAEALGGEVRMASNTTSYSFSDSLQKIFSK